MKYELPNLPYAYDALVPYIDAKTMEIHHTKHHQAYTDKLNTALEKYPEIADKPLEELLKDIEALPIDVRTAIRNNGGGYINHNLFWKIMDPSAGVEPSGDLMKAINSAFQSFDNFKVKFAEAAVNRFGSGWAWLVVLEGGVVDVYSTPNQDSPIMEGKKAIMGLDVWEHAYYLQYQNRRPEYIENFWNIVDWRTVGELYREYK
mgnify:CR=1 FL=1